MLPSFSPVWLCSLRASSRCSGLISPADRRMSPSRPALLVSIAAPAVLSVRPTAPAPKRRGADPEEEVDPN